MTLEEAEWIATHRLPEEPPEDGVAAWRASQPRQEPRREGERKLDTMPMPAEPPIDWAAVIRGAILVFREAGVIRDCVIQIEAAKPTIGKVQRDLFA
jgi:hypothetical protein